MRPPRVSDDDVIGGGSPPVGKTGRVRRGRREGWRVREYRTPRAAR